MDILLSLGFLSPIRLKSLIPTQKIESDTQVRNEGLEFIYLSVFRIYIIMDALNYKRPFREEN